MAAVIGWGAALAPLGLLRLPVIAIACFATGGLMYAPYPALSAILFQREARRAALSGAGRARRADRARHTARHCARRPAHDVPVASPI